MRDKSRYVYVIASAVGVTNVGVTDHLARRLGAMQAHSPVTLSLFNSVKLTYVLANEVKAACHKDLDHYHSHGEWFNVDPEIAWKSVQKRSSAVMQDAKERQQREDWLLGEIEGRS